MADILRIKRRTGGAPGGPGSLASSEIAFNEVDRTLYYGLDNAGGPTTSIIPIGGTGMGSTTPPAMDGVATPGSSNLWSRGDHRHPTDLTLAPLNSPALTGLPTAPTAAPGTSTAQIATTAFVAGVTPPPSATPPAMDSIANPGTTAPYSRGDHVHPTDTTRAPLDSPHFTGVPTAPVPVNGTNTGQLATTSYVLATRLDQFLPPNTDVDWAGHRITGLGTPTQGPDAVPKSYVDSIASGIDAKASCRAASVGNVAPLFGTMTIDGVALAVGDRVLVKDQTAPQQNGIYIVETGNWLRASDADTWPKLVSAFTFVESGATNADVGWVCTVDPGGNLETTPVTWAQFSSAGQVVAGSGLAKVGNVLNVVGTTGRIVVGTGVDIDGNYAGQPSITTLGAVVTGTWLATMIALAHGGTGATAIPAGYVTSDGTKLSSVATLPPGAVTGLGTMATQNANAVAITGGTIDGVTFDCGTF
jgi:hypothetical protein